MFESQPRCPKCGLAMVRRARGRDGAPFWGCSTYPRCRGTRELAGDGRSAVEIGLPLRASARAGSAGGRRPDPLALGLSAGGLLMGIGFVLAGLTVWPSGYQLLGAVSICAFAVLVAASLFMPANLARRLSLRLVLVLLMVAVFAVALAPSTKWLGHYLIDSMLRSIATHTPPVPIPTR